LQHHRNRNTVAARMLTVIVIIACRPPQRTKLSSVQALILDGLVWDG
jgi:hypothetical protein